MFDEPTRAYLDKKITDAFRHRAIPPGLWNGLREYITNGRPTGLFLEAVISNDLKEACQRADLTNRNFLFNLVSFLYDVAPAGCWGSRENYSAWVQRGREALTRTELPTNAVVDEGDEQE